MSTPTDCELSELRTGGVLKKNGLNNDNDLFGGTPNVDRSKELQLNLNII